MSLKKLKALVLVLVMLFGISLTTVGCKQKSEEKSWVNTKSMPGSTFKSHAKTNSSKKSSAIVYLGSGYSSNSNGFGPRDISFEFKSLK